MNPSRAKNTDVPGPGSWAVAWSDGSVESPELTNWEWRQVGGIGSGQRELWIGRHTTAVPDGPHVIAEPDGSWLVGRCQAGPEAIRAAARAHGDGWIERVDGAFAIVTWDGQQLFAARDRLGLEPMFRYAQPGLTVISHDVDVILAMPQVEVTPDPEFVALFVGGRRYRAQTIHREIRRVMPAHWARSAQPGSVSVSRWWNPEVSERSDNVERDVDEMRQLLLGSVEGNVSPTAVHGAELSGGLDSSAVVGTLAPHVEAAGGRLPVFSQVLEPGSTHPGGDEREYIEAVLARTGIADPHWVYPFDPLTDAFVSVKSRTSSQGISGGKEKLIAAAAEVGVTDLWSGFGGDEYATFNGRNYHGHLLLNGRLVQLGREVFGRSRVRNNTPLQGAKGAVAQSKRLIEAHPRWPGSDVVDGDELYFTPAMQRLIDVKDLLCQAPVSISSTLLDTQRMLLDLHPGASRAERENGLALRYGMIFRYPLQDHRLVEFSMSLPPGRHMNNGWHRWLWREATAGLMPDIVRWRTDKRPPMPGGALPEERYERVAARNIDHKAGLHPLALDWIDVERAERDMLAAARRSDCDIQDVLGPRRAIAAAYRVSAEAKREGW